MNGLIRCNECGKLVVRGSEEMIFADGHFYCKDCAEEWLFECDNCGEYHHKDYANDVYTDDGTMEHWCADCVISGAFVCNCCGEIFTNDQCTETEDGDVCDSCLYDYYTECHDCGGWFRHTMEVAGGHYVCERCRDDLYEWCSECNEYVLTDNYDYDHDMCEECWENREHDEEAPISDNARVRGYHCPPPMVKFGDIQPTWDGVWRGIGVELEVDGKRNTTHLQRALNRLCALTGDHIYFEYDGSLTHDNSFEMITHPHTIDAFYELPWEQMLKICEEEGFMSHDAETCGLHMHFSREMFGADRDTQEDNIAKLVQFYELYWDDCLKVSRRTDEQARNWARRYNTANKNKLKKYVDKTLDSPYNPHYMAINSGGNTNTVEIRLTRGTLNHATFMACCDFMITVVKNSCRIGWSDTTDDAEWLKGLQPYTVDYLRRHGAFRDATRSYCL